MKLPATPASLFAWVLAICACLLVGSCTIKQMYLEFSSAPIRQVQQI